MAIMWAVATWSDTRWATVATIVQAIGTLTAIFVGGGFAFYRLHLLRTFHPHLTIEHEVSHRQVGDSYVHIALTVRLMNTSGVVIELRSGYVLIQQIAPVLDEEVANLFSKDALERRDDIQWPTLDEIQREWDKGDLVVEPNETLAETYEFVVPRGTESVLLNSFYRNPMAKARDGVEVGWDATTIYDILDE